MGKPTICICENKDADQLRSNCEADQRLCFRYSDSTVPLLLSKSKISSFNFFSVLVQVGLCRTCSETTLLVFQRGGSFISSFQCLFQVLPNDKSCQTFRTSVYIRKTCPCNKYPLKPHFYMQNWGMQGFTYFSYFCSKT